MVDCLFVLFCCLCCSGAWKAIKNYAWSRKPLMNLVFTLLWCVDGFSCVKEAATMLSLKDHCKMHGVVLTSLERSMEAVAPDSNSSILNKIQWSNKRTNEFVVVFGSSYELWTHSSMAGAVLAWSSKMESMAKLFQCIWVFKNAPLKICASTSTALRIHIHFHNYKSASL